MVTKKAIYKALQEVMTSGELIQETGSAVGSMVISVSYPVWQQAISIIGEYQVENGIIASGDIVIKAARDG